MHTDALTYLKSLEDDSFDIVYFDPMFSEPIESSAGIMPMRKWAVYSSLDENTIKEAKRIARSSVVLKEHFNSPLFTKFGFQVKKRPSAKFHYGTIEINE